ncbi:serine--tRNA ligase, mitochondrial [Episyrphus balteatus]|uniref:serine--tRNA ligase, mitochondrial n=1 Tax=Episyrphus balteatus TaxID=286459 RepID=UPI002485C205|nr:serine--tRNA ligase, mitochondrial [Episyrphus balteatus]
MFALQNIRISKYFLPLNSLLISHSRNLDYLHQIDVNPAAKCDATIQHELDSCEKNAILRKHRNNVPAIRTILENLNATHLSQTEIQKLQKSLQLELLKLPNKTHPRVLNYGDDPKELSRYNKQTEFTFKPKEFSELATKANLFRMDHLGNFTGHKSYYLMGAAAEMEHALTEYFLTKLKSVGFRLMSVPDILPKEVIEGCGMQTSGERTQVYKLNSGKCLSGTSEMALAGFFANKIFDEEELPIKVTSVSRCYRAETSGLHEEKGMYRVHQFTKVEMFSVCAEEKSEEMLESFKNIEISLFDKLGIHFKLLDMPPSELGAPAYQKYDIESWMPGRQMWGEISSCSNCTDYQAKRLNIRYRTANNEIKYAHTVNGTAGAIPRLLITLFENNQLENGAIRVPTELRKYINNIEEIKKEKRLPELKLVKHISSPKVTDT